VAVFSGFLKEDPACVGTIVEHKGRHETIWITEEELFRAVLGNKEFEKRRAAAFGEDYESVADEQGEIKFEPMDIKRYIQLSEKKKKEGA
jgi:hypothetical protein